MHFISFWAFCVYVKARFKMHNGAHFVREIACKTIKVPSLFIKLRIKLSICGKLEVYMWTASLNRIGSVIENGLQYICKWRME